jgi:hypothetical protein
VEAVEEQIKSVAQARADALAARDCAVEDELLAACQAGTMANTSANWREVARIRGTRCRDRLVAEYGLQAARRTQDVSIHMGGVVHVLCVPDPRVTEPVRAVFQEVRAEREDAEAPHAHDN